MPVPLPVLQDPWQQRMCWLIAKSCKVYCKILSKVNSVDKGAKGSYRIAKKISTSGSAIELSPYWAGCSKGDCVEWGSKDNIRSKLINNCPLKQLIWDQPRIFLKSWKLRQFYFFCSLVILTRSVPPFYCLWNKVLCYYLVTCSQQLDYLQDLHST